MIKIIFEIIPPIDFKDFFCMITKFEYKFLSASQVIFKVKFIHEFCRNLNAEFFMIFLEQTRKIIQFAINVIHHNIIQYCITINKPRNIPTMF
jgi:hypothetical protein